MDLIHSLFAAPSYLAQVDEPEHPRELQHLRFVGPVAAGCTVTMWRPGAVGKFPIAQQAQLPTHDETLAAVLAGQGIGTLPLKLAIGALASGRIVHVLPEWEVIDPEALDKELADLPASLRNFSF